MSSKRAASSRPPNVVVDTVVLHYFLLVDQVPLLIRLLESPMGVPRIVYDPDDAGVPERAQSEISKSVSYHRRAAGDPARDATAREASRASAKKLASIAQLHQAGHLEIMDLRPREIGIMSALTSESGCKGFGLLFPLGPGEAACLTIGTSRGLAVATDDSDALKALRAMNPRHPYERIRKLLIRAAEEGLIPQGEANNIHAAICSRGFWDKAIPFAAK